MTRLRLTTLWTASLLAAVAATPAAAMHTTSRAAAHANHRAAAHLTRRAAPPASPAVAAAAADPYAGGVPVSSGHFGYHCTINWVPTPADANLRSPYAANVFDGNVQAFVPPVPPGYKGPIRKVQGEICRY